jgi:hypothetical protein
VSEEGNIHWADDCPFGYIDVPHKPAEIVFKLAAHKEREARKDQVASFLEGVDKVEVGFLSVEEVIHHAEQRTDLHPKTLTLLKDVVEEVASK